MVKRLVIRLSVRRCVRLETCDGGNFDRRPGGVIGVLRRHRLVHLRLVLLGGGHIDGTRAGQDIVAVGVYRKVRCVDIFAAHLNAIHKLLFVEVLIGLADQIVRHIQTALDDHLAVHVQPRASDRLKRGMLVSAARKVRGVDGINLHRIALRKFPFADLTGIVVVQAVEKQLRTACDGARSALLHAQGRAGQEFEIAVHGHFARRAEVESRVQRHPVVLALDGYGRASVAGDAELDVQLEAAGTHLAALVQAVDGLVLGKVKGLGHAALRQVKERTVGAEDKNGSRRMVVALQHDAVLGVQLCAARIGDGAFNGLDGEVVERENPLARLLIDNSLHDQRRASIGDLHQLAYGGTVFRGDGAAADLAVAAELATAIDCDGRFVRQTQIADTPRCAAAGGAGLHAIDHELAVYRQVSVEGHLAVAGNTCRGRDLLRLAGAGARVGKPVRDHQRFIRGDRQAAVDGVPRQKEYGIRRGKGILQGCIEGGVSSIARDRTTRHKQIRGRCRLAAQILVLIGGVGAVGCDGHCRDIDGVDLIVLRHLHRIGAAGVVVFLVSDVVPADEGIARGGGARRQRQGGVFRRLVVARSGGNAFGRSVDLHGAVFEDGPGIVPVPGGKGVFYGVGRDGKVGDLGGI